MGTDSRSISEAFPGFSEIYLVGEPAPGEAFRVNLDVSHDEARALTMQEARPASPVRASWFMGAGEPADVIRASTTKAWIVSERFLSVMRSIKATGWSTYDVTLTGSKGEQLSGYSGLPINGRCGAIDNSKSVAVDRIARGRVLKRMRGLYFDPATWDGSDLFVAEGTSWLFVLGRLKEALEQAHIGNLRYTSLVDFERSAGDLAI